MLSYHSINSDHRHVNRLTCQLITDRVVNNSHKVANNDRETVFKMSSAGQRPWQVDTRSETMKSMTYGCCNDDDVIQLGKLGFITARQSIALQALYMLRQIRPSVCPSHAGIVSNRGNAEGCSLHRQVAQCLYFSDAKNGWWGTTLFR